MASRQIIIRGMTSDGKKFRPSDWAERLYYALASYGPNRKVRFHPLTKIKVKDGIKCFVFDPALQEEDEMTFDFLIDFARENDLIVIDQDCQPQARV